MVARSARASRVACECTHNRHVSGAEAVYEESPHLHEERQQLNSIRSCAGKDIMRFHAVMWPALLMSAGLPPPRRVFGHGFLTKDGLKMGKALGNVLDPVALVNTYGADPIRFFLMREIRFGQVSG